MGNEVENLFMSLSAHHMSSLAKYLFRSFAHLLKTNFPFWKNFKLTEKLQPWYREFLSSPHPGFSIGNISHHRGTCINIRRTTLALNTGEVNAGELNAGELNAGELNSGLHSDFSRFPAAVFLLFQDPVRIPHCTQSPSHLCALTFLGSFVGTLIV